MIQLVKMPAVLAAASFIALTGPTFAQDFAPIPTTPQTDRPVTAEPVSYNGYSCDMVRAKVAESGITAAYAYARYMGMTSRDIARVRKACSV